LTLTLDSPKFTGAVPFAGPHRHKGGVEGSSGVNGLADQMRQRTRALHRDAERSGIVARMIAGTIDRPGYRLYLQNLLPVYRSLEAALERLQREPAIAPVFQPALFRRTAIASDIVALGGDVLGSSAVLPAARALAEHIEQIAERDGGARLIAHVYTRYLGDLNGGQILAARLQKSLDLQETALRFHRFPDLAVPGDIAHALRAAIDRAGAALADVTPVVEEAATAFAMNIDVSREAEAVVIQA
jgi:heme oxygenase